MLDTICDVLRTAICLDEKTGQLEYDIIGLDRHGVVVGKDAWTTLEHAERLEHICQIVLAAHPR